MISVKNASILAEHEFSCNVHAYELSLRRKRVGLIELKRTGTLPLVQTPMIY